MTTLSEQFLRGREAHLHNKRAEVARRLRDDLEMPEQHRAYKVRALIPAIERAFDRIRRGTYGSCTACGEAIPIRRLELRPEAEQCVPCVGGAT